MMPITVLVENAVESLVNAGEVFTAFDVTQKIRQGGSVVRHYMVKDIVHDMWEGCHSLFGNHTRTNVKILMPDGTTEGAWCYHDPSNDPWRHPNVDPNSKPDYAPFPPITIDVDYGPDDGEDSLPCDDDPASNMSVDQPSPQSGSIGKTIRTEPLSGRLNIPADIIRAIGAQVSDEVEVKVDTQNNTLIISKLEAGAIDAPLHVLVVTIRQNIRLSPYLLVQICPDPSVKDFYCMENGKGQIFVSRSTS